MESPLLIGGKKFAESSETALVFLKEFKRWYCSALAVFSLFFWGGEVL